MGMEQAIAIARKAVANAGTKIGNRFLAKAEYKTDPSTVPPDIVKDFSADPHWLITYLDPENDSEYPVPGIRVFVFSATRAAIFAP